MAEEQVGWSRFGYFFRVVSFDMTRGLVFFCLQRPLSELKTAYFCHLRATGSRPASSTLGKWSAPHGNAASNGSHLKRLVFCHSALPLCSPPESSGGVLEDTAQKRTFRSVDHKPAGSHMALLNLRMLVEALLAYASGRQRAPKSQSHCSTILGVFITVSVPPNILRSSA